MKGPAVLSRPYALFLLDPLLDGCEKAINILPGHDPAACSKGLEECPQTLLEPINGSDPVQDRVSGRDRVQDGQLICNDPLFGYPG